MPDNTIALPSLEVTLCCYLGIHAVCQISNLFAGDQPWFFVFCELIEGVFDFLVCGEILRHAQDDRINVL